MCSRRWQRGTPDNPLQWIPLIPFHNRPIFTTVRPRIYRTRILGPVFVIRQRLELRGSRQRLSGRSRQIGKSRRPSFAGSSRAQSVWRLRPPAATEENISLPFHSRSQRSSILQAQPGLPPGSSPVASPENAGETIVLRRHTQRVEGRSCHTRLPVLLKENRRQGAISNVLRVSGAPFVPRGSKPKNQ